MSLSTSSSTSNIPTFVGAFRADAPPSAKKPHQQPVKATADAKLASAGCSVKLTAPAPIPSIILQETAEDERHAANTTQQQQEQQQLQQQQLQQQQRQQQLTRVNSQSLLTAVSQSISPSSPMAVPSVVADEHKESSPLVTMATSNSQMVSAVVSDLSSSLAKQPIYVQVMLQLPGSPLIPVNIPAEVILPTLKSIVSTAAMSTSNTATSTTVSGSNAVTRQHTLLVTDQGDASRPMSAARSPVQQQLSTNSERIKIAAMRRPEAEEQPSKIPRLSEAIVTGLVATGNSYNPLRPAVSGSSVMGRQGSVQEIFHGMSGIKSDSSDIDDEYKKGHQQSNKTAATRCRQKRKQQVENMEKKAKDLMSQNKQLEVEMQQLKQDICELENLLKEHEDCFASHGGNLFYTALVDGSD